MSFFDKFGHQDIKPSLTQFESPPKFESNPQNKKSEPTNDKFGTQQLFAKNQNPKSAGEITEENLSKIENDISNYLMSGEDSLKQLDKILEKIQKEISGNLKNPALLAELYALKGFCYFAMSKNASFDDEKAVSKYEKWTKESLDLSLKQNPESFRANYYMSQFYLFIGEFDNALRYADSCYKHHPKNFNALNNKLSIEIMKKKQNFDIDYISKIEEFIKKNPESPDLFEIYKIIVDTSLSMVERCDENEITVYLGKTQEYIEKWMQLEPKSIEAKMKLAKTFIYLKKFDECIKICKETIKTNSTLPEAYFYLALAYSGKKDEKMFEQTLLDGLKNAKMEDEMYFNVFSLIYNFYNDKNNNVEMKKMYDILINRGEKDKLNEFLETIKMIKS